MRGLMLAVWLVVVPVGICRGDDEQNEAPVENVLVTAWAEKLSEAFRNGGDRVLVFEATKPDHPAMRFRMAECQSQQVAALQMESDGEVGMAMGWFASAEGAPKCLHAMVPGGEVMRVVGFERLMEQLSAVGELMGNEEEHGPMGLDWAMYLTKDTLIFNVGVSSLADDRRAPWLKEELLVGATDVELGEEEVVFVFPEGGKVVVRKDGVLLRQEFPAEGVDRTLRLVEDEKMEAWSVEDHFTKFDPAKVRVEDVGGGRQGIELMQGFYLGMIEGLASMEDASEKLDERKDEILERMMPLYRPVARRVVKGNEKLAKVRIDAEIRFGRGWEQAQEKFPEETRLMTYAQFIDSLREPFVKKLMETMIPKAGAMMPPVLDPKVRAGLTVKELVVADHLRELGAEAMAMAVAVEIFEAAAANERMQGRD